MVGVKHVHSFSLTFASFHLWKLDTYWVSVLKTLFHAAFCSIFILGFTFSPFYPFPFMCFWWNLKRIFCAIKPFRSIPSFWTHKKVKQSNDKCTTHAIQRQNEQPTNAIVKIKKKRDKIKKYFDCIFYLRNNLYLKFVPLLLSNWWFINNFSMY